MDNNHFRFFSSVQFSEYSLGFVRGKENKSRLFPIERNHRVIWPPPPTTTTRPSTHQHGFDISENGLRAGTSVYSISSTGYKTNKKKKTPRWYVSIYTRIFQGDVLVKKRSGGDKHAFIKAIKKKKKNDALNNIYSFFFFFFKYSSAINNNLKVLVL